MQQVIVDFIYDKDPSAVQRQDQLPEVGHHLHTLNDEQVCLAKKLVAMALPEITEQFHFDVAGAVQRVAGVDQPVGRADRVAFQLIHFQFTRHRCRLRRTARD